MMDFISALHLHLYAPHIVLGLIMAGILYAAHHNSESTFNVFDYFIDPNTGKASITRTLQLLAGLTATWVVVQFTATNKLTYDIFGLYLIAVGASEAWTKYVAAKFGSRVKEPKVESEDSKEK